MPKKQKNFFEDARRILTVASSTIMVLVFVVLGGKGLVSKQVHMGQTGALVGDICMVYLP